MVVTFCNYVLSSNAAAPATGWWDSPPRFIHVSDRNETLTVNRGSYDQCAAEDHGCNYDGEGDVVILFELLSH